MDNSTTDQPKGGNGAAHDGQQELTDYCPHCHSGPRTTSAGGLRLFHCGTMQEVCGNCVKTHAPSEECQRRSRVPDLAAELARVMALIDGVPPTTDNLEQYGKAVARQPILPEYGTLNPPPSDPYAVRIGGVLADPARIARAYEIHDGMLFSALKKILRSGRKHKDMATDIREAITSLERWEAMNREDAQ